MCPIQRAAVPVARVLNPATFSLTLVTGSGTSRRESNLALKGRRPVMPAGRSECGARGRGFITSVPGRLRASACRHYDRCARCIAVTGARRRRGDPPPLIGAKSREAWPEAEPWGRKSLWREPWWNAGRRARPQAEGGASRFFVARTARRLRAGHETLRLPAFRLPFIWSVIVIEAGNHRRPNLTGSRFEGVLCDWRWHSSGAHASREWITFFVIPLRRGGPCGRPKGAHKGRPYRECSDNIDVGSIRQRGISHAAHAIPG